MEGEWYWLRSPEQEQRKVIGLYNRYCIRCHGVDGRGVWDIPDVPDFTNGRWQVSFANQDPPVVWQLSQCATDVRGSELRNQASIGLQGSLKGRDFSIIRTPRSRTDGLDYAGQLVSDSRIEGTFTGTQAQTGFTAVRIAAP